MRIALVFAAALLVVQGAPARADDGPIFHRTTPRGSLGDGGGALVIGVPGGRAWGIESDLRPLPPTGSSLYMRLAVNDPVVREAFVRVAYYASATARTRQLATYDSVPVTGPRGTLVAVPFEPPPGAVAYRIRVLARLSDADARSSDDAITARLRALSASARPSGSLVSRLLP